MLFNIEPLRMWVHKVLPVVYDDSLSYYEVLAKTVKKLNEVIDLTDEQTKFIQEFSDNLTDAINEWEEGLTTEWTNYKKRIDAEWKNYKSNTDEDIEIWKHLKEVEIERAVADGIYAFAEYFEGLKNQAVDAADRAEAAADEAAENAVEAVMPTLQGIFDNRYAFKSAIGSPLVAQTAAEMTDTNKIYVYVGNETGYVNGNWYYYDGTAWESGGVYNSVAVVTDTTLTQSGVPADAKVTGDEIGDLKSATNIINKYGADVNTLDFEPINIYGIKLTKNSDGSYTWSGTASQAVNSRRYQFEQTVGVTYHYKLNPSYDNTSSSYYFYVTGVNGNTSWNKSPEITWTATTSGNVSIAMYCPTGATINETINPIINTHYSNAELYGLISTNTADIQAANELATSGKVILIGESDIEWENSGTVINYLNGELSSGNPSTYVATKLIDISKYSNLVLTFEGYTQGQSGIVFYDDNDHYVNGVAPRDEAPLPDYGYRVNIQVPSNAHTCRIGAWGTNAKKLNIYITEKDLLEQLSKTVDFRNTIFKGGIRKGSVVYPAFPMIPSEFETYAPIAYGALIDIMTANGYDTIPVYILSDSHGNAISPFAWLNEKDDSIKCLHLGDIANDQYNTYEIDVYGAWAKRINNIATVTGNHDVSHGDETMREYEILKNFVTTDRHMGGSSNYYYVDDGNFRVRYIALDAYKIADDGASFTPIYQADQIAWFAETLKNTKYDVIMLSHYPLCDSAEDRDGTTFTCGPYATNQAAIQSIINAYQNKQTVSVTVGTTTITADYTNADNTILCAFSGHMHREGTGFQSGVRSYIAQNYQSESNWASAFVAIDRNGGEIKALKFDNSQNYTEWDLPMTE